MYGLRPSRSNICTEHMYGKCPLRVDDTARTRLTVEQTCVEHTIEARRAVRTFRSPSMLGVPVSQSMYRSSVEFFPSVPRPVQFGRCGRTRRRHRPNGAVIAELCAAADGRRRRRPRRRGVARRDHHSAGRPWGATCLRLPGRASILVNGDGPCGPSRRLALVDSPGQPRRRVDRSVRRRVDRPQRRHGHRRRAGREAAMTLG